MVFCSNFKDSKDDFLHCKVCAVLMQQPVEGNINKFKFISDHTHIHTYIYFNTHTIDYKYFILWKTWHIVQVWYKYHIEIFTHYNPKMKNGKTCFSFE